jgi:hypothetical protein
MFAAHLTATKGAQKILGLHGTEKAASVAIGALGLAAASVSIIYRLREIVLTVFLGGEGTDSGCDWHVDNCNDQRRDDDPSSDL